MWEVFLVLISFLVPVHMRLYFRVRFLILRPYIRNSFLTTSTYLLKSLEWAVVYLRNISFACQFRFMLLWQTVTHCNRKVTDGKKGSLKWNLNDRSYFTNLLVLRKLYINLKCYTMNILHNYTHHKFQLIVWNTVSWRHNLSYIIVCMQQHSWIGHFCTIMCKA